MLGLVRKLHRIDTVRSAWDGDLGSGDFVLWVCKGLGCEYDLLRIFISEAENAVQCIVQCIIM